MFRVTVFKGICSQGRLLTVIPNGVHELSVPQPSKLTIIYKIFHDKHTRGLDIHVTSTHTTSGSNHKGQVAFKLGCRRLIGLLLPTRINLGGWSKALLALFACHPKFLASAKLFAVPKVPKVPNFF